MSHMKEIDGVGQPRTAAEIARRSIALHCVLAVAHGVSKDDIDVWMEQERLGNEFTPRELAFMTQGEHSTSEKNWMTWMVEAQVALLWSIQKLKQLPPLSVLCDTGMIVAAMPDLFESTTPFIEFARRRSVQEVQRAEARIYSIHCRLNQATRNDEGTSDSDDKDVVFFRHYGLSWVVDPSKPSWDEVQPDT